MAAVAMPLAESLTCDNDLCSTSEDFGAQNTAVARLQHFLTLPEERTTESESLSVRNPLPEQFTYRKIPSIDPMIGEISYYILKSPSTSSSCSLLPQLAVPKRHTPSRYSFVVPLLSSIEEEPVEDGYDHPAEEILAIALSTRSDEVLEWFRSFMSTSHKSSLVASVLTCLGRVKEDTCPNWGYELAANGLKHRSAEVRDAAVQLLELWEGDQALIILTKHEESVDWLDDYIKGVISYLQK